MPQAVVKAAMETGVSHHPIDDLASYGARLRRYVIETDEHMSRFLAMGQAM